MGVKTVRAVVTKAQHNAGGNNNFNVCDRTTSMYFKSIDNSHNFDRLKKGQVKIKILNLPLELLL